MASDVPNGFSVALETSSSGQKGLEALPGTLVLLLLFFFFFNVQVEVRVCVCVFDRYVCIYIYMYMSPHVFVSAWVGLCVYVEAQS